MVLNESAAKTFFGREDPIGKHVEIGQGGMDDAEVIGDRRATFASSRTRRRGRSRTRATRSRRGRG